LKYWYKWHEIIILIHRFTRAQINTLGYVGFKPLGFKFLHTLH